MFVEGKTPMAEKDVPGKITQGEIAWERYRFQ